MKKYSLVVLFCLFSVFCAGQGSEGCCSRPSFSIMPSLGVVMSLFYGPGAHNESARVGVNAGAELGYMFNKKVGCALGVFYTQQGSIASRISYDLISRLDYVNFPLLLNVRVSKVVTFKAGFQLGVLANAKFRDSTGEIMPDDMKPKDMFKGVDCSLPIGVSCQFGKIVIESRMNYGLLNIVKSSSSIYSIPYLDNGKVHNFFLSTSIGYIM